MFPSLDECTGCSACFNSCSIGAISMIPNAEGFAYPVINNKCINCGECTKKCPVSLEYYKVEDSTDLGIECFAAYSKNEKIRFESTSGGIFTHLATNIIRKGGVVIGAKYRDDHLVEHTAIYNETNLELIRQSKYIQSDIGNVYTVVKNELEKGKYVLFSGAPCQCAGLKLYLDTDYEKLFVCDFICRGVNSPRVYLDYLNKLERIYNSKVKKVWFKNKTYGWNRFATKIVFESGEEYIADRETDSFMLGYIKSDKSSYMRESCYSCKFKGIARIWSDITLGDFWGVEKHFHVDSKNGVSALIVQSPKIKKIIEEIKDQIWMEKCISTDILDNNPCLCFGVPVTKERIEYIKNERR